MKKSIKSIYSFLRGVIPEKYQGEARFIFKVNFVSIPISWYGIVEKSGGFDSFMAESAKESFAPIIVFLIASPAIYAGFLSFSLIGFELLNWFLKQTREDFEGIVFFDDIRNYLLGLCIALGIYFSFIEYHLLFTFILLFGLFLAGRILKFVRNL